MDYHQANLKRHRFLFNSPLRFNPTPIFLESPYTVLSPFLNMYFRRRPSSSRVSRAYALSLFVHGALLRSPTLFCIKLFFGPFSLMLHPDSFLFLALPTLPSWNAFTKRLVAPSSADSVLSYLAFPL